MSEATTTLEARPVATRTREMNVDILRYPDRVELVAEVPGVSESELEIQIEENVLRLETQPSASPEGEWAHREFAPVRRIRQFRLDDRFDREGVKARIRQGILHLTLPYSKAAAPRKIRVEASEW